MGNILSFLQKWRVYTGFSCVVLTIIYFFFLRRKKNKRTKGVYGPRATEKLINPGTCNYDKKMREIWGGPAPKFFPMYFTEWPNKYALNTPKKALVTGGTGGIGFYVVKLLAKIGYEIILPARPNFEDEVKGAVKAIVADVPEANIIVPTTKLDLASFQSVREFAEDVRAHHGPSIDLLCLNAGRGGSKGDPKEVTVDGFEAIMQVNAMSHFLLCAELWPLLNSSSAARIISQSSGARLMSKKCVVPDLNGTTDPSSYNAFRQYILSKAANCWFTLALNEKLDKAGITNVIACVVDPGLASTGVNIQHNLGHSLLGLPDGWLSTETMHKLGQHAADGALPMVLACVTDNIQANDWFTPKGSGEISGKPAKGNPADHKKANKDPMNPASSWPSTSKDEFWHQAMQCTKAKWNFS